MGGLLQHLYLAGTASGVMLGLFFAVSLVRPRQGANNANRLLGAIFASLACSIVTHAALNGMLPKIYPNIRLFTEPFVLLVGPFLYCYIQAISYNKLALGKILAHFVPFVVAIGYAVFLSGRDLNTWFTAMSSAIIHASVGFAIYAQLWIYYLWNRRLLQAYTEQLKQSCSSIEKINQAWVSYVLAALLGCYTLLGLVFWRSHSDPGLPVNQILAMVLSGIVFVLAYRMLRQPEIFAALPQANEAMSGEAAPAVDQKYQKSGLDDAAVAEEFRRLEQLMDSEKPYMDAELNLQGLAEKLPLSPHHLSQVINHGAQSNFYEFVNEYRVAEVRRLISDPANDHMTLLGLAYAAGFNSKATFNRFFKKVTGNTPTQFRKQLAR